MNYGLLKILLIILGSIALLGSALKILKEYERAVVFRLGKLGMAYPPDEIDRYVLIPAHEKSCAVRGG